MQSTNDRDKVYQGWHKGKTLLYYVLNSLHCQGQSLCLSLGALVSLKNKITECQHLCPCSECLSLAQIHIFISSPIPLKMNLEICDTVHYLVNYKFQVTASYAICMSNYSRWCIFQGDHFPKNIFPASVKTGLKLS